MACMTEFIDVQTEPMTAFTVFTEDFDQWWGRGPIDAYDTWRLVERRIEAGVGGRLVEDYGNEELIIGTITSWEPGARLAWTTPNHVTIEVTFEAHDLGTRIRVTGTVPDGIDGTVDLSMVRMAPQWFPRYIDQKARGRSHSDYGRLHLVLRSAKPATTARWLADVFQLEPTTDIPDQDGDPNYTWIEFRVGTSFLVLWGGVGTTGADSPFVYVDNLDAHRKHTEAAGATIVSPITEHGFRSYTAADCDGRYWIFAQSGPRLGR
jgi:hypothetical protein